MLKQEGGYSEIDPSNEQNRPCSLERLWDRVLQNVVTKVIEQMVDGVIGNVKKVLDLVVP